MIKKSNKKRIRNGFTMMEVMAVLIILGVLATLVVRRVSHNIEKANITVTQAQLKNLHQSVNDFNMHSHRYPTAEEGLDVLIRQPSDVTYFPQGGYLETTELPKDSWGNDFYYERFPENGMQFLIRSFGPDGEMDTEDDLLSTDA